MPFEKTAECVRPPRRVFPEWVPGVLLALTPVAIAQSPAPLAPPTGVAASDGAYASKIAVTWDPIAHAKTYRVFRSAANAAAAATAIGATSSWVFWDTSGSRDAALLLTVGAGNYTMVVTGCGGTTGTALVEIFVVP